MATALFILGHAGSGKSYLARQWLEYKQAKGESWALMDKDTIGDTFGKAMLKMLGFNENDRDSLHYKNHIRDLEYQACLQVIKEQLEHNINVVIPGPWTKEINNATIFCNKKLGFPPSTQLKHVYLDYSADCIKDRIIKRAHPRDEWKISNWSSYAKGLEKPINIDRYNIFTINENNETTIKIDCLI